jgi:hypothetical protein
MERKATSLHQGESGKVKMKMTVTMKIAMNKANAFTTVCLLEDR